jgi:hypothetical protein
MSLARFGVGSPTPDPRRRATTGTDRGCLGFFAMAALIITVIEK